MNEQVKKKDKGRILLIDDQMSIHEDFRKVLTHDQKVDEMAELEQQFLGERQEVKVDVPEYQIDSAYQGQEGLEKVKTALAQKQPYMMAFVDMRMPPGWDGLTTIKHIWEIDKDIQVVICSAYSDYSWKEIVSVLGHSDRLLILKKPFDNIEIIQMANNLCEKWRLSGMAKLQVQDLEKLVQERTNKNLEMQKQVFHAAKLASIGELAAGVATARH
ncbi:MAG: response regulator, partial [Pseudomonadota bacterium]